MLDSQATRKSEVCGNYRLLKRARKFIEAGEKAV
jgi:hypothetical protein